ncbi:class I fructose-bisphosphate aldolase [Rossellomorea sp. LjRoot5]|uniref:class I fructose-bisphosphate aldolase n=1 Tax=Rossellomorea sp. LjRoot5 TaxID=3342331 RepID=UPI003ECCE5E2
MSKSLRMNRLFHPVSRNAIFFPVDHGTTLGPLGKLTDIPALSKMAEENNFQSIVAHKGTIHWAIERGGETRNMNYLLHLSASTNFVLNGEFKQLVSTIEHGLRIGVSGISVHVNLGVQEEPAMLKDLGLVCDEAYKWGLPVLAMMNVFGEQALNPNKNSIAHAVRVAGEVGADIVKVKYPGTIEKMEEAIQAFPIPVLISGGEKSNDLIALFKEIHVSMKAGARGVSIGRNIFEDRYPAAMSKALSSLVHDFVQPEEAVDIYLDHSAQLENSYLGSENHGVTSS